LPISEARGPEALQDSQSNADSFEYEGESKDRDTGLDDGSLKYRMGVLESDITSVLSHDLGLAAHLIPRFHARLQPDFLTESTSYAGSESSSAPEASKNFQGLSSIATNSITNSNFQQRKRGRDPDDPGENGQNDGFKKPRPKFDQNQNRRLGFACPFHKRLPQKYCVSADPESRKYRTCLGPGYSELRRLK